MIDILFVNPNSSLTAYQDLAKVYSAIEPPTWALLLAESCRSKGYQVAILDSDAERLSIDDTLARIEEANARLICFVLYGQNPNSGTTSMIGATQLGEALKRGNPQAKLCLVGSHVSALPRETLALPFVDFILLNEGVYALHNLLKTDLNNHLSKVKGIGYKPEGVPTLNPPERVVPQECMDVDLPGYAWDLLPYKERPLDLYRAHFWHANFDHAERTPFASIYTSLGCQFACDFCMINIVNRVDNGPNVNASHSKRMRFWSPGFILKQLEILAELGVKTLRISDEMFFLNRKYFSPLIDGIIERNMDFNMWAYSRIDTVQERYLEKFKTAGINWLALGVEAGNQTVREEVSKGTFKEVNIRKICNRVQDADIKIISNYIFGFPEDTIETMTETLNLALELNTEMANMYPCQALPGSPMYYIAQKNGWQLPTTPAEYAFLSYECLPLQTKYLSSAEVLKFRDEAWNTYFTNPAYLMLVERNFGVQQRQNIEDMAKIQLRRKILEDANL